MWKLIQQIPTANETSALSSRNRLACQLRMETHELQKREARGEADIKTKEAIRQLSTADTQTHVTNATANLTSVVSREMTRRKNEQDQDTEDLIDLACTHLLTDTDGREKHLYKWKSPVPDGDAPNLMETWASLVMKTIGDANTYIAHTWPNNKLVTTSAGAPWIFWWPRHRFRTHVRAVLQNTGGTTCLSWTNTLTRVLFGGLDEYTWTSCLEITYCSSPEFKGPGYSRYKK